MIEDSLHPEDNDRMKNLLSQMLMQPTTWFPYHRYTTSYLFPANIHVMVSRPDNDDLFSQTSEEAIIESPYYYFFRSLVDKFCKKHNLKFRKVIRACINRTFNVSEHPHGDPHIDFTKDHIVILIYLSSSNISSTIIFDKVQNFDNKNNVYSVMKSRTPKTFPIKKQILPERGKIIAFDGKYYHTNAIPPPGEDRIVCAFNLLR